MKRVIWMCALFVAMQTGCLAGEGAAECKTFAPEKNALNGILGEYLALPQKRESAEPVFLLFQRLEQVMKEVHALYPEDYGHRQEEYDAITKCLWDEKYGALGIYVGHYSDRLEFYEKLLADAHKLDPHSRYRAYTLYTQILGKDLGAELGAMPDVAQAKAYLQEFPDGPYASDVYGMLGGFYHDLYMSLSLGESTLGESYSCYAEYVAKHPSEANAERARRQGIMYFKKYLATVPRNREDRRQYEDELRTLQQKRADNVINWCTD
jgi:hypothetical protein